LRIVKEVLSEPGFGGHVPLMLSPLTLSEDPLIAIKLR
jgi:hypothetical protein